MSLALNSFLPEPESIVDKKCLEVDRQVLRSHFDRRPFLLDHYLVGHPLLELPRLIELARKLDESFVEYNAGNLPISIEHAKTPRNGLSIEETIHRIEHCSSWMVLKRVEQDPEYAALLNRCLDELQPWIEPLDPGMYDRAGAVFISSPGAVTPYHMDEEYNFLAQLRGGKTIHVFDFHDRSLLSDEEIEHYYTPPRIDRNLVFQPHYQNKAYEMSLVAGKTLHIPPLAPHWVKNGPEVSISFSIGFLTQRSYRRQIICSLNRDRRRRGWNPIPYGRTEALDRAKYHAFVALSRATSPLAGARTPQSTQHIPAAAKAGREVLNAQIVDRADGLRFVESGWHSLLKRSQSDEPMLSPEWISAWWNAYGGTGAREPRTVLFFDREGLAGVIPLQRRVAWYRQGLPFRRLTLVGCDEPRGERTWSEYLSPIAERGAERALAQGLADLLAGDRLGAWDELVLPHLNGDGPYPSLLADALAGKGFPVDSRVTGYAPYIQLPKTWDEYLQALTPSGRYLLRRSSADFEAWAGDDWQFKQVTSEDEIDEGLRILAELHERRWESIGAGLFHRARFRRFHREVMHAFLRRDALQLCWLVAKGQPIAALYNLVWNNKVYFYQSGRENSLPRGIRPGVFLHAQAIRQAIAQGRREYDFLEGESQYKRKLATHFRPLLTVRATKGTLVERLRAVSEPAVDYARTLRNAYRGRLNK